MLLQQWSGPGPARYDDAKLPDGPDNGSGSRATCLTLTVLLTANPDGGYTARVPALPELVTAGSSPAETLALAEEAIRALLASRAELGTPLPQDSVPVLCQVTVEDWVPRASTRQTPSPLSPLKRGRRSGEKMQFRRWS
jgi:antitoxin HicB